MGTRVLLTIDTELAWRHHAAGCDAERLYQRSIEPAGVGVHWQLERLAQYGLNACFFVDPMPAAVFGPHIVERIVKPILAAGQDVQLHIHPHWKGARRDDRFAHGPFNLTDHAPARQRDLLIEARDLLVAAGAKHPVAFRSGSYAASDATLEILAELGIRYDTSHNGAHHPNPSAISLAPDQIAPLHHADLIELPVTQIGDGRGRMRHFQICALSTGEMEAALVHASANGHALVTIVSHSFEIAARSGLTVNGLHRARFEWLCRYLAAHAHLMPTLNVADLDRVPLGQDDTPLAPNLARRLRRQAEQFWSNQVEERAA